MKFCVILASLIILMYGCGEYHHSDIYYERKTKTKTKQNEYYREFKIDESEFPPFKKEEEDKPKFKIYPLDKKIRIANEN